jgi:2'-5' RNA ligase
MLLVYESFVELFRGRKQPLYAALRPDEESCRKIADLIDDLGIENPVEASDLHATVLYSRKPVGDASTIIRKKLPVQAKSDRLEIFPSQEGKNVLVLKLSSVSIRALHHELIDRLGASHDFPTFEPHVTLCYDYPSPEPPKLGVHLDLDFDTFVVRDLDDEAPHERESD